MASLLSVLIADCSTLWEYTFPIFSISIAGIYDAYGRMEKNAPKNIKLGIRIFLNFLAMILSAVLVNSSQRVRWIPPAILVLCGVLLLREIWQRVVTSIQMSEWYPN